MRRKRNTEDNGCGEEAKVTAKSTINAMMNTNVTVNTMSLNATMMQHEHI